MTNKPDLSKQLAGALRDGAGRAKMREQLAIELGYNISDLKAHEAARLDAVCALRAEIDFLQARRGGELDVARLIAASTALTELLSSGNKGTVVEFVTLPGEWEGDGPI